MNALRVIDNFLGSRTVCAACAGWFLWHVSPDAGTFIAALIAWNALAVQIDQIHDRAGGFHPAEKSA